jgi:hypothetical protein
LTALTSNIPALWHSSATSNADRKRIIRCLLERVTVHEHYHSEYVDVTMRWAVGHESLHQIVRPVATFGQLRDFDELLNRVQELREGGHTAAQIAEQLHADGYSPPRRRGPFTTAVVHQLLKRRGLLGNEHAQNLLGQHEWWLTDLARALKMSHLKLRDWANRGWVHSRRTSVQQYWILWADKHEVRRLRALLAQSQRGVNAYTSALTTPTKTARGERPLKTLENQDR